MWDSLHAVSVVFAVYAAAVVLFSLVFVTLSIIQLKTYMQVNRFAEYKYILSSPLAPGISLIAPAYNEGLTIVDNVKSLLALVYNNYEIIIVNDGSKDDTLQKMISAFDLVKVNFDLQYRVQTKAVRQVLKSRNKAFRRLVVIDKENGGKADALNAGLNLSKNDLVACIDVDCVIESEALLKMVKPFLEDSTVIASGGVVRIANSCRVEDGRLIEVRLPESNLALMQVMEYIRAFLIGRLAWTKLNGLILISGAFGLFKREIAVQAGGYDSSTVGEDMELVVRMRRWMYEHNYKHRVAYIPDPLCWTEAPSSNKVLGRQRNRWTRGTFETLYTHRTMLFNYRYGLIGMLSFPYWMLFEWLAPFVEIAGVLFFFVLAAMGMINWNLFFLILACMYCYALFLSSCALLAEEISFYRYTRKRDVVKMFLIAMVEPFWFHPRVIWWAIKGNIDQLKGKKEWGEMTRKGFVKPTV